MEQPVVGVVMGSESDWEVMRAAVEHLQALAIPCEQRVVSAHRTPDLLFDYAAGAAPRGLRCIKTIVPVLGVPVPSRHLQGLDSLLSIVQMPKGVPVATFAIGAAGAANAALFAAAMLAGADAALALRLLDFRARQETAVMAMTLPETGL
ncbi:MAG: AIR carboxylase family protein [Gammaproteobacteria bacterium]|nr:AIR carboxylase family protein [Gammaproteobacteria bacterium]